jgi:hypothetical protein
MADRTKGQIPISMGTALAIEGALGIYPERPESPPPIASYDSLWVNLRTVYRNLQAGFQVGVFRGFRPAEVVDGLLEDLAGLHAAIKKDHPNVEVVVYLSEYERLEKIFPAATLKENKTPIQLQAQELEDTTYAVFRKNLPPNVPFAPVKCFLPHLERQKTLLMTHVTLDLLARYHFRALDLLESNTGIIKKPAQWNTKLGVKEQADVLPFNSFTLQVFGDRGVLFQPQPLKLRQQVLALAEQRHWSSITSLDRIRDNLRQYADKELRDRLAPFADTVLV